ncbi:MAG: 2OG-Fe(II) oxygenase family protein [Ilumatobacteraceae bacterium]|nr:2OG-Fe(II) oxygenase family protein [Ilumatobacteraceae bacterium]
METVPVIDIGPFIHGSDADREVVAAKIAHACEEIGFFQITGHGVSEEFIQSVYDASRAFFDLPEEDKEVAAQPAPDQVRGWSAVGKEGLSYSLDEKAPGDLKEKMDMGPFDVPDSDPYFHSDEAGPHFAANVWPSAMPELRPLWESYFAAMSEVSRQVMRIFAVGLGLDIDYFEDKIDRHISMFRVLNYPDQPEAPLAGQLRAGAHSDYGSLTLLRQEQRPGGLQVMTKNDGWMDVPAIPGALVVNIGDLMAEWTNDRWVSTLHRVVNPPREQASDSRRISLVFFHQPNYDAMIECLPTCLAEGEVPKHVAISSGNHLYSKFVKQTTFGQGVSA